MTQSHLSLFANCVPVRGHKYSAIYDLQRKKMHQIPTIFLDVLDELSQLTETEVRQILLSEKPEQSGNKKFIRFILEQELGFFSKYPERFPKIDFSYREPDSIHNAIIDVNEIKHDFAHIFSELDDVGCEYVQIRAFSNLLSITDYHAIAKIACHRSIRSIEFIAKYDSQISELQWADLARHNPIISRIYIHSAAAAKISPVFAVEGDEKPMREIYFTRQIIASADACGRIEVIYLDPPTEQVFSENINRNGCLNRKIAIDAKGELKNCPSMQKSFGKSAATPFAKIVLEPSFQAPWYIRKDQIEVCRDCEFRYACSDCRAHLSDPNNPLSKPAKCSYDPYQGRWLESRHGVTNEHNESQPLPGHAGSFEVTRSNV
jgi:SPASM domain peptide maturase of grasp-with-spasm system